MPYCPIRVGTLRADAPITFDVYIPIGDRMLHYMRVHDEIDADRLDSLTRKQVEKLYIKVEEMPAYEQYLNQGLDQLQNPEMPIEERATIAHDTMTTAAENAEQSLDNQEAFKSLESQLTKVQNFLLGEAGALESVLGVAGVSDDIFQHSATVSSLAVSLGQELGIRDAGKFVDIGVAGLLHDFGKTTLRVDPLKQPASMTDEELQSYHRHPKAGAEALKGKQYVSSRVLEMIESHEELGQGEGFPQQRNVKRLPKYCQIICLANAFDRLCIEDHVEPLKALEIFQQKMGDKFDAKHVKALFKVVSGG